MRPAARGLAPLLLAMVAIDSTQCLRITREEAAEVADRDQDGISYAEDCDDADTAVLPGAMERPDQKDNDCDGLTDEGTIFGDDDGDGYSEEAGDCDDADDTESPAAVEFCGDGVDNDCSGWADDENGEGCTMWYMDLDEDGFGSMEVPGRCLCSAVDTYTSLEQTDCYDYNALAHPGSTYFGDVTRGDLSYDYDCDGAESHASDAVYSCEVDWSGFSCSGYESGFVEVPDCGWSGTWHTGCEADWFECSYAVSATLVQTCN